METDVIEMILERLDDRFTPIRLYPMPIADIWIRGLHIGTIILCDGVIHIDYGQTIKLYLFDPDFLDKIDPALNAAFGVIRRGTMPHTD